MIRPCPVTASRTSALLDYAEANPPRGGYENASWTKKWLENGDPCPRCHSLNGKVIPADANYTAPVDGRPLEGPPEHPNCACHIELGEHYFNFAEKVAMQIHGDTAAAQIIERANPQGHAGRLARQIMAA